MKLNNLIKKVKFTAFFGLFVIALTSVNVFANPTKELFGGDTSVVLSQELIAAAGSLNLSVRAIRPARQNQAARFSFPITSGLIDFQNAKGEIIHGGGLRLSTANTTVNLRNFIIDTTGTQPVLTGIVTANNSVVGRIPLFKLTLPAIQLPIPDYVFFLTIPNVDLKLTAEAAAALNQVFGVTAFTENFPVGTARVRSFTFDGFNHYRGNADAAEISEKPLVRDEDAKNEK